MALAWGCKFQAEKVYFPLLACYTKGTSFAFMSKRPQALCVGFNPIYLRYLRM